MPTIDSTRNLVPWRRRSSTSTVVNGEAVPSSGQALPLPQPLGVAIAPSQNWDNAIEVTIARTVRFSDRIEIVDTEDQRRDREIVERYRQHTEQLQRQAAEGRRHTTRIVRQAARNSHP